jgi:hypothetical protein
MTLNHPFNVLRHANQWEVAPRGPFAAAVGAFLFPGLVGAGSILGVSLATVAGFLTTTAVTSWLVKALSPKPKDKSRGLQTNVRDPIAAHEIVYGEVRKGGVITFLKSSGTGNRYLHMVLVLAGHEVEAIDNLYINDEVVTWNGTSGLVTTAKWNNKIRIRKFLGGPGQVASSELISEAGVTSDFVGNGIAYLYIRLDYDQRVFAEGIPTFTAVVRGKKVFNPATATTAYSDLSSLCIRDYLVSAYGVNQQAFANSINDTYTNAATTVCDQNISLAAGGTEKRYTVNGVISTAQSPKQNLESLLSTCGGTIFWSQGQWHIKVGSYSSPTITLTENDLRSDISLVTKNSRKDNFNTVQGVFNDASQRWLEVDYPEIKSATFITEDGGEQSIMGMDLPLTTSAASAQRLAKMALFRSREQFTFVADFALTATGLQPGDSVNLTLTKYGFSAKPFEVLSWNLVFENGELLVRMTLKETSAAAYDWAAEETDILSNNTTLPDPTSGLNPTNVAVTRYGNLTADGSFVGNAKVSWDASDSAFISYYTVQWKRNSDTIWSSTTTGELSAEVGPIEAGVVYNYRVMATSLGGFTSAWVQVNYTLSGDNTIPAAPTSPQALGGYKFIELRWVNPVVSDLSHVNIYVNTVNNSGTATLLGKSTGTFFIHGDLAVPATRYYWLKSVDFSGNESSSFSTGVNATTIAVPTSELSGEITTAQIADNALTIAKFAAGLQPIEIVATLPTSGNFAGRTVFLTSDNKIYRHTGSPSGAAGFTSVVPAADLTGTLDIARFANTIRPVEVVGSLPGSGNFEGRQAYLTTDGKLYRYKSGAWTKEVDGGDLIASSIVAGKIAAGVISATEIASGAITTVKLAAGAVTANELATNSVIAGKIQAGAVSTAELAAGAVTAGKLAVVDTQNLALNGDFVYQFEGWGRFTGSLALVSAATLPGRTAAQLIRVTSEVSFSTFGNFNNPTDATKGVPVTAGQEFYVEAYARKVGVTNPNLQVNIVVVDSSGTVLVNTVPINASVTTTAYTKFSNSITVNTTGFAFLRLQNSVDNTELRVGSIKWYRRNAGELIVDGSITANKISTTNLAAISANLGAITAGSLNINNKFIVASNGDTTIQSAATGERLLLTQQRLDIYDASNNLRIRIGLV